MVFYRSNPSMAPTPMDFFDLANLLDNDGNLQNEMMVIDGNAKSSQIL